LADLFITHGVPEHVRSDNGPEFTAKVARECLGHIGARTLFIEPGSQWEHRYVESFNGKLRDELLDLEVFYTLKELEVVVEQWMRDYNQIRAPQCPGLPPAGT
jgi:transposase InsO family protein